FPRSTFLMNPPPSHTHSLSLHDALPIFGAGWAARCLAAGHDVIVSDPSAEAFEKLQASVQQAWPVLRKRGLAAEASTARVRYEQDLDAAVEHAYYLQESAPEL